MNPLLEVRHLRKKFAIKSGWWRKSWLHAVDDVSFDINTGETLGLVGESGCGKSTLGRCIARLHRPSSGSIKIEGHDISALSPADDQRFRRHVQMIFQDPYASLNPRFTIEETLLEPLRTHRMGSREEQRAEVKRLLDIVGLRQGMLHRYPHEFSGGQRQRVGIARALALKPKLIVADEPVSALDVSVQAQVLNLIKDLQRELGISFLMIAHDLAVVQHVSQRIGVMYLGQIVELTDAVELYKRPLHPYTQVLLSAIPGMKRERLSIAGEVPSPLNAPAGCPFQSRCPKATAQCRESRPTLRAVKADHWVACHHIEG